MGSQVTPTSLHFLPAHSISKGGCPFIHPSIHTFIPLPTHSDLFNLLPPTCPSIHLPSPVYSSIHLCSSYSPMYPSIHEPTHSSVLVLIPNASTHLCSSSSLIPTHPPTHPFVHVSSHTSTHKTINPPRNPRVPSSSPVPSASPPSCPTLQGLAPDPTHHLSCSHGTDGWGCHAGCPAAGSACGEVSGEGEPVAGGSLPAPLPAPACTSWRRWSSGCRRCHPRHSRDPGPGSSQHRLPRTHHSGAGPGGSRLRPRTHTAVAVGDKEDRVRYYLIPTPLEPLRTTCSGTVVALGNATAGPRIGSARPVPCYML